MSERRRIALAAAILFAVVFAVYASGLPSGVSIGDQAEAQTVPYILGIAHPAQRHKLVISLHQLLICPVGIARFRLHGSQQYPIARYRRRGRLTCA